jgi:hypothetical protein
VKLQYTIERRLEGAAILENNHYTVAYIKDMGDDRPKELIDRANAADDLLASLEEFLEADSNNDIIPNCTCAECTRYHNAYAAIEKARGLRH